MGFIHADKIKVHVSKGGGLSLKYPFLNKNGDEDFMYLEIDARIFRDLAIMISEPFRHRGMRAEAKVIKNE